MNHVPVAWQCPGWNIHAYIYIYIYIHFSSDISTLWAECHISPCLYSSLYLYNQVKEGKETIQFTERQSCRNIHTHIYIHFYIDGYTAMYWVFWYDTVHSIVACVLGAVITCLRSRCSAMASLLATQFWLWGVRGRYRERRQGHLISLILFSFFQKRKAGWNTKVSLLLGSDYYFRNVKSNCLITGSVIGPGKYNRCIVIDAVERPVLQKAIDGTSSLRRWLAHVFTFAKIVSRCR
jgi:hypothetical protein